MALLLGGAKQGGANADARVVAISSPKLVRISPNGEMLATAQNKTLTIRVVATYEVHVHVRCSDEVQALAWSPDSELIACSVFKRSSLEVFAVRQPDWRCRIDEGVAGLTHSAWAPDSRHIVTFAEFQIHMTLWSLTTQKTVVVQKPKEPQRAVAFCATLMAVATRKSCKDSITVFDCDSWETVSTFPVVTSDLSAIMWNEDGSAIVAQESCLRYLLVVYSPTGEVLRQYAAYEHALGIRNMALSPEGAFLAVASFDQSMRLLNSLSWEVVVEFPHTHPKLLSQAVKCTGLCLATEKREPHSRERSVFVRSQTEEAFVVPTEAVVVDNKAATPRLGVSIMRWSHDGRFVATKNENMPRVLWLWSLSAAGLHTVIVLENAVRCVAWSPTENLLYFSTGGQQLYEWTPDRIQALPVKDTQQIWTIQWTADGASVALCSAKSCACFDVNALHHGHGDSMCDS